MPAKTPPCDTLPERLLTKEQLSEVIGLSVRQLRRLTVEHQIPHYRITQKLIRYDPAKVLVWLEERERKPVKFEAPPRA